ncbi:MAG TPA: condensation domain-containing protein, partial [Bacillota bacterium]|nr:condensation domain-containing protein [Bacillota bacterium]
SDLSLLPPGAAGEMYISGDGVARGYLNRPELTAEKFVVGAFRESPPGEGQPQRRMYRTGDLARFLDNGKIEYLGRVDQQVKIHGYRIELGEIERQLMSHESIQDAVVIDRQLANGDKYLCGYVTIKDDSAAEVFGAGRPGIPEIKNDLRKVLPEYMIPKYLMVIDEIPLTANGKVNRKLLPEPLMDEENAIEYVAPGNEIERTLVHLAGETLGIPQIGMKHNFFHYGGDSIKAIQIASKLNELGLKIRVRDILSHPVLEEMARCVESDAGLIDQAPRSGAFRPTPIYAWFLSLMLPKPDYYNQSVILSWKQKITVEDLEVIMDALVQHHDSLRLNYDQATGRLYYCDDLLQQKYQVQYYDLASALPGEQDEQVRKFSEALKAGFTLERGFLIKTCLFDLGPRGRKVLITAHHLVVDGVSWRILLNDVYRCYQQIRANQPVSLPPKTHSLQEWAGELEEYSTGGANQEKAYWKGTLQNKFTFPPEFDRGEERIAFRQEVTLRLSPEETGQLLLQANTSFGTEPQELLITALILAIGDYTGRQEIMIELEGHGREEIFKNIDLTRTVGWFTSLYPVAFRITGSGLAAQIKEVKEGLRRVPNKGVGFGILRNYCEMTGYESRRSIRFNYLGDFSAIYENECFQYLDEDTGPDSSPSNPLTALIDINALVVEKMLKISLAYSSNKFSPKTMETVAGKFKARLLEIIRFCCNQGSVELTASDFTMVKLDQDDLESLLE